MTLVDTTVWIDFFAGRNKPHTAALQHLIENEEDLCLCGVVLTETLQGIRSDADYSRTKDYFSSLIYLQMKESTFVQAADIYRALRKRGITVRKPVDCMIASVAIEYGIPLLHNDRDFVLIARHSALKLYEVKM